MLVYLFVLYLPFLGNEDTVANILQHRLCPPVNAKNELGKLLSCSINAYLLETFSK